ncbi:acyl-CoA dehydrogenase family protein [Paenibacillus yanchengensis]|uniref:Acyl-CoA dehydrogenase family protein n=1 Tax=Paenibacillus yanchengensis TaxID=2035833 RepID=A0ABW4YJK1_9BACL
MKELFINNDKTKQWLTTLEQLEVSIKQSALQADEQNCFVADNIELVRKSGYSAITLPSLYGGAGFSIHDAIVLQETLASYDGSTALVMAWTLLTVGELYENQYWDDTLLQSFSNEVTAGAIINRAVSEAATGSPIRGGKPTTTAIRNGNQYIITGRKSYTTGAYALDYFLVSAWLQDEEQIGFFLLAKDTPGLQIEDNWDMVGMRGTGSHDVVLNQVTVDENKLVEIPSYRTGFKLNPWLLLIPATYLGIAQAAATYAIDFANRHQPNSITTTIAHLPNVQSSIGEMELLLLQARHSLYGTALAWERQTDKELLVSSVNAAKHTATNHAIAIVDIAMRIVGAKSLQLSNPLQRYYRDVRAGLHNPPMDDLTISLLAKHANNNWRQKEGIIDEKNTN